MKIHKYYKWVILVIIIIFSFILYKNIKEGYINKNEGYMYSNRLKSNTIIKGNNNIINIPNNKIITDPYECFNTCVKTPNCGAYDMSDNICHLKINDESKYSYSANTHTYIIDKNPISIEGEFNKRSDGKLLKTITGKTYTQCYYNCINNKNGCNSITIDFNPINNSQSETGTCWLYSNVKDSIDASNGLIFTKFINTNLLKGKSAELEKVGNSLSNLASSFNPTSTKKEKKKKQPNDIKINAKFPNLFPRI
jgi:hypothetical protein